MNASGPLKGVKVLEFARICPGPFAGMLLSCMWLTCSESNAKIPPIRPLTGLICAAKAEQFMANGVVVRPDDDRHLAFDWHLYDMAPTATAF